MLKLLPPTEHAYLLHLQRAALATIIDLIRVDDLPGRRPLSSTNTNRLVVPQVKLSTVGSRAFAVAAPDIWNRLPTDVVAANSLSTFRRLLKRFLFRQSYPDLVY